MADRRAALIAAVTSYAYQPTAVEQALMASALVDLVLEVRPLQPEPEEGEDDDA